MQAIQDHYSAECDHCYGCGPANPHGFHLKSYLDGDETIARFTPSTIYSGGYPGHVYGGMIASLLNCHGTASAAAFAYLEQNRTMGDGQEPMMPDHLFCRWRTWLSRGTLHNDHGSTEADGTR